ncbi:hypothetical protein CONPUDRAFT_91326 [Coniophora puteana RWD-64-598 SS2]|uniref:Zinc finger PHD-type domain-containing protein n=1 Tax=Coniophora puteana (strain RWD-64-598) TaxID=741705 RepID=A0A5M3MJ08_CONPW|nr:uncharacterized protein CONPUDRAFT_91326 [Coniophora puteana RWD-64-598 SS2]EIW78967.1 hypothetical protein CONPUDRAFT_91326 [Coniophora puteana RWD-64-598 SS2]
MDRTVEVCGFCLQPTAQSGCVVYLRPTRGSASSTFQVDDTRSLCPNLVSFAYHSAATASESAPCTNVPLACPICSPTNKMAVRNPAIWRYSMVAHLRIHHASSQLLSHLTAKFTIPPDEIDNMRTLVWARRFTKSRKSRKVYHAPTLAISDAHRTSKFASNEDISETSAAADEQELSDVHAEDPDVMAASTSRNHDTHSGTLSDIEDGPAESALDISLDAPEFVENDVITRAGRKSRKRDLNAMLRTCDCDKVVTQNEINDGVAIRCKYDRCETGWFHLTCMYLDCIETDWRCPSHARPTKRAKRGGKK